LLASIPRLDSTPKTQLATIPGMVPALSDMPDGCRFRNRCDRASARCQVEPTLRGNGAGHGRVVACHHPIGTGE
jgi:peptide/nickel transport system ATP-binding protein